MRRECHHPTILPTYHACSLHSFREAGGIGLAPEHVAAEGGRAGSHDECERVDISAHSQEGEEAHSTLSQHCLCLEGGAPVSKEQTATGTCISLAALALTPQFPLHGKALPHLPSQIFTC